VGRGVGQGAQHKSTSRASSWRNLRLLRHADEAKDATMVYYGEYASSVGCIGTVLSDENPREVRFLGTPRHKFLSEFNVIEAGGFLSLGKMCEILLRAHLVALTCNLVKWTLRMMLC